MNNTENQILRGKKVALLSLGCKVNSYETDSIRKQFEELGAETVDFDKACSEGGADVFVINTCSVTNIADRKSRQMLRRARQNNPGAIVAATGCYAQIGAGELIDSGCADLVAGNSHKSELTAMVAAELRKRADKSGDESCACVNVSPMKDDHCYEEMLIDSCDERVRAYVKIEDGCNQFCTYCLIPYARGRVRSRSEESILDEVRGLAEKGFHEVVLTGIHLSSYGMKDYEHANAFDHRPLLELIHKVADIEGIERIRLGSLEPRIISREFAEELADVPKFCPYFHLSLQSGCDSVLKRMNRHYTAEEFAEKLDILRDVFDRPSLNTDVITGFPGETEEEFEETRRFLERVAFSKTHIFKYSRRKGTAADRMPGQLTEAVKHERSKVLDELDRKNHHVFMESFAGERVRVLIETEEVIDGEAYYTGLTERYVPVAIPVGELDVKCGVNTFAEVTVRGFAGKTHLLG